jgi:hypothetical protein
VAQHFNGAPGNIGVLLGAPSGHLIDVDLDFPECLPFARIFLPDTRQFGRQSNPVSHWLYIVEDAPNKEMFRSTRTTAEGKKESEMVVEIRGNTHQSIFPGSTHTTGEPIRWVGNQPIHKINFKELRRRCGYVAAGAVLSHYWPRESGNRHECALALAGLLLRAGFDVPTAEAFIGAIAKIAGNDAELNTKTVKSTKASMDAGRKVTGWLRLSELLNAGESIADVPTWLGYSGQFVEEAFRNAEEPTTEAAQQPESDSQFDNYIEFAPTFLSVEDPPIQYLVQELIREQVIALLHGEPRSRKSWAALELAIAMATGTPAFGLQRFLVPQPVKVLYSSQEDVARDVRIRAKALLRGRGITSWPETLAFAVHKGISLERREWHEALIRDVTRHSFRFVAFDPIRRYGVNVDKGPSETGPLTGYLRRLVATTGTTTGIVHHDVKPPASGPVSSRRRSHNASGGDWFASAECPISFEKVGEMSIAYPEDYKSSVDPQPFSYRVEANDPQAPTIVRLIGEDTSATEASDFALHGEILTYLAEHIGASGSSIAQGIRRRKDEVLAALEKLETLGKVDSVKAPKKGVATTWFLKGQMQTK